ncbi:MAG: hypothetical protein KAJ90_00155 [Desulfobacterales bacterium]|nr:hypothetical protein [Desulfobacterales bacterium]
MKFTSFLHKKLVGFLNDHRIVARPDPEDDFKVFATAFIAPYCEVGSAGSSVPKTRRRADRKTNKSFAIAQGLA